MDLIIGLPHIGIIRLKIKRRTIQRIDIKGFNYEWNKACLYIKQKGYTFLRWRFPQKRAGIVDLKRFKIIAER